MAEFNRFGGGGKRFGGQGGRPSFGGGRPSFGKKPWNSRPGEGAPAQRYPATCSNCGKETDVPFRPVSGKPIYCRDCFTKAGETAGRTSDRSPRKEYTPREAAPRHGGAPDREILTQLEMMNAKLERLIHAVEASATKTEEA